MKLWAKKITQQVKSLVTRPEDLSWILRVDEENQLLKVIHLSCSMYMTTDIYVRVCMHRNIHNKQISVMKNLKMEIQNGST